MTINYSVFNYLNYQEALQKKFKTTSTSYRTVALQCDIHPSYFSRVMQQKADFSPEQLFAICRFSSFDEHETDYLLLLLEHASSALSEHRRYLKEKINRMRKKQRKLETRLSDSSSVKLADTNITSFYLDALTIEVETYLGIPRFGNNPQAIAQALGVSEKRVLEEIDRLILLGLIRKDATGYHLTQQTTHLDEDESVSAINHTNWRLKAISRINERDKQEGDYHFSVVFSANKEVKENIRERFKDFLVEVQQEVQGVEPPDEVYRMTFDLF